MVSFESPDYEKSEQQTHAPTTLNFPNTRNPIKRGKRSGHTHGLSLETRGIWGLVYVWDEFSGSFHTRGDSNGDNKDEAAGKFPSGDKDVSTKSSASK